ncbi:MAG: DUF805 domain-containing protein [Pseudomonadota bacterium]
MTFLRSVKTCLFQKHFDFSGRASRSEYWWFILAYFIFVIVVIALAESVGSAKVSDVANWVLMAVTTIPLYAAGARRLHDTNRSGWWQILVAPNLFVQALPTSATDDFYLALTLGEATFVDSTIFWLAAVLLLIFSLVLLVWTIQRGTDGPNRYGDDPLQPGTDAEIFA